MSYVLFRCAGCSADLSVVDSAVGTLFTCPACHAEMVVQDPDFSFGCSFCNVELRSTDAMSLEKFDCPECGGRFVIPAVFASPAPPMQKSHCPNCWTEVSEGATVCVYCQRDIRTGKQQLPAVFSRRITGGEA